MKKRLPCLSLLLLMLCGVNAQKISQYEYWTDDDYANRSIVEAASSDITLNVSTDRLGAGIHFLNFRASRSDGVWGNYYRYLYYIPTLMSTEGGGVSVDYWLDDNRAERKNVTADDGQLSLTIDINMLSPGVHFFNCTPMSESGEWGNSERYMFYVPLPFDNTTIAAISGYEYWFDDDYAHKVMRESNGGESVFVISLVGLDSGVHYFNCRAINERGEYGNPVREMFYIPQTNVNPDAQLASVEYWLDDDYANKVSVQTSETEQAFTIDVSELSSGVHYFNYRAMDNNGRTGNLIRQMFYLARGKDAEGSEYIEYEYWIDEDVVNKITGQGSESEYLFTIDVSSLSVGVHTFNFRAKNRLDQWGETFVQEFEISLLTVIDVMDTDERLYDVYNLSGVKVMSQMKREEMKALPSGIYIVGGKKILVP